MDGTALAQDKNVCAFVSSNCSGGIDVYKKQIWIVDSQCCYLVGQCYCGRFVNCAIVNRTSCHGACYSLEESHPSSSAMELESRPHQSAIVIRSYASSHLLLPGSSGRFNLGSDGRGLCKSPIEAHTRLKKMTTSRSLIFMSICLGQQPVSNTYEEGGRSQDSCQ